MTSLVRNIVVASISAALTACASMSAGNLFSHYSAQHSDVYQSVSQGQYQTAQDSLPEMDSELAGPILDNMERGRVELLNQNYALSLASLKRSDQAAKIQADQPIVSLSETAASVGALAANDNLTSYEPADYELGFLHLYLGLNYLKGNDLEGALVEIRRANMVQEQAKKRREAELESAEKSGDAKGINENLGAIMANYPAAGKKLQAVQNGYLLYFSALLYEAANDLNSAYVDYKRALAVMPENREIIDGTLRVGHRLGMKQDLAKLEKRYGKYKKPSQNEGRVIIIDEQRVVQAMDSWQYSFPYYDGNAKQYLYYNLSLPYYPNTEGYSLNELMLDDATLKQSQLVDVNLMAGNNLSERMPSIIIRQALRVIAKEQIRREAAKNEDDVGNVLLNLWNILTEQADTRSWQTLPAVVYSSSKRVKSGTHSVNANGNNYEFEVSAGRTTLVWVSRQGQGSIIWHKQLGAIK
ncbi:COG3014 family protein [Vibrio tapetis]|uniref:Putative lipoprotein n=1 Tax=Vibrio tapetis subsp. tapetis TaxID=1671868 RepID=A0A2N8ZCU2_9VIBR|nr:putative lipoprotein [Vibrio tapetis subsp. tapetis]